MNVNLFKCKSSNWSSRKIIILYSYLMKYSPFFPKPSKAICLQTSYEPHYGQIGNWKENSYKRLQTISHNFNVTSITFFKSKWSCHENIFLGISNFHNDVKYIYTHSYCPFRQLITSVLLFISPILYFVPLTSSINLL